MFCIISSSSLKPLQLCHIKNLKTHSMSDSRHAVESIPSRITSTQKAEDHLPQTLSDPNVISVSHATEEVLLGGENTEVLFRLNTACV